MRKFIVEGLVVTAALYFVGCSVQPDEPSPAAARTGGSNTASLKVRQSGIEQSATVKEAGAKPAVLPFAKPLGVTPDEHVIPLEWETFGAKSGGRECCGSGDVNGDSVLSASDAQMAFFITLSMIQPTAEQRCAADWNNDGQISAGDAQAIFFKVLEMPTASHDLPCGCTCTENEQCAEYEGSRTCNTTGTCCIIGDVCEIPDDCPASYTTLACDQPGTCQGYRIPPSCVDGLCATGEQVADDTACDDSIELDDCGPYPSVTCSGEPDQDPEALPQCATSCTGDVQCDDEAYCIEGLCRAFDGEPCGSDAECVHNHCANGFCCLEGDCCDTAASCPEQYWADAVCDAVATCQGHRVDATCADSQCSPTDIPDDSACDENDIVVAVCGWYAPATCTGAATQDPQNPPTCATSCVDSYDCAAYGHCNPSNHRCQAAAENGWPCQQYYHCLSGHCQNNFCCDSGDCCGHGDAWTCPAFYHADAMCDDQTSCQGHRVDPTCINDECGSTADLDDDTACVDTMMAKDCQFYLDLYCTGEQDQPDPQCPTTCEADDECDANGNCDPAGPIGRDLGCIGDLEPGGECDEDSDCAAGLVCSVDNVCCNTACDGTCESCVMPEHEGECLPYPANEDPENECAGISCSGYYAGWGGDNMDICYTALDLLDDQVGCNGQASTCQVAAELCPSSVPDEPTTDCDDICGTPMEGTCQADVPGTCSNNDLGTSSCGVGACYHVVPVCVNAQLNSCVPLPPTTEICDGIDNNCNSQTDERPILVMCPLTSHVGATVCQGTAGCRIAACDPGFGDLDATYPNGCECFPDTYDSSAPNDTCAARTDLGNDIDDEVLDTHTAIGRISRDDDSDYYRIRAIDADWANDGNDNFHLDIRFAQNPGSQYRFDVWRTPAGTCPGTALCTNNPGSSSDYFDWYTDFHSTSLGEAPCTSNYYYGGTTYTMTDGNTEWCTDNTSYFIVRVFRAAGATPTCEDYQLRIRNQH